MNASEQLLTQRHRILRAVLGLIFIGFMLAVYALLWPRLYGFELGATTILAGIVVKQLASRVLADLAVVMKLEVERQGGGG